MTLMAEAIENYGDRQLLQKKSRRTSCGCCASCCSCCIYYLSGFILLMAIAGLVLCARIFLEFPVIINGFRNTMNFTQESVDALMSDTQYPTSSTNQAAASATDKCKMLVGSFKLLNATYLPQYNDTSSAGFQRANQRLQAMLITKFNNSLLQANFRKASVFAISPDPVIAHFQLLFCSDSTTLTKIKADNVSQVLRLYNASRENISIDVQSVTVGDLAPCPGYWDADQTWPWQIILQENQITLCTGSLLTGYWVLTSADCVQNRNVSLLTVTLEAGNPSHSSTRNIDKIIQHPNFTAAPVINNFALIRLSEPAWFTSSLMPICLSQTLEDPAIGSVCSASTRNVATGGLLSLVGNVTSGQSCLSTSEYGLIYLQFSISLAPLQKIDTGNALVCMNTDNTTYLQGISLYLSNSSLLSSTCLSYTSIGTAVDWINSSLN